MRLWIDTEFFGTRWRQRNSEHLPRKSSLSEVMFETLQQIEFHHGNIGT